VSTALFDAQGVLINGSEAIGELVNTAGAGSFEGYFANDEATALRTRHGWYWSGDLAYRDEAGYFYFAGRGTTGCASTGKTSRRHRSNASRCVTRTLFSRRCTPCPIRTRATRSCWRCN